MLFKRQWAPNTLVIEDYFFMGQTATLSLNAVPHLKNVNAKTFYVLH